MSEPQEQTKAMTVMRERLITEAPAAMFDSAAFEHLQRVATVIFRSGFVPKSLTHDGPGDTAIELPEAMVVARCILLADQANRAGADVVGYIQATSVINGRLMHEGKLVNAIVQRRLGIRLKYRFGLWDTDHIIFPDLVVDKEDARFNQPIDPNFFHGAAERLAVRAFNPESTDEYVEGSVGQWKTTRSGSPWSKAADWPRQLRYRAVREWARAYDPGTVLGMIADGDQEIEMITDVTPRKSGVMARLEAGETSENGFNAEHVERQTKPRGRKSKETAVEDGERPTTLEADTAMDGAPTAEAEPDTSVSAAAASEDSQGQTDYSRVESSEPTPAGQDADPVDVVTAGEPNDNEIYMLVGDDWIFDPRRGDERRTTYKNGEPFSDAGRDKGYKIYEDHAAIQPSAEVADEAAELPAELQALITATETVESWPEVKDAMGTFQKGTLWPTLTIDQQNHVRASAWDTLVERAPAWLPDHGHDLSAFRLWVEAQTDPELIRADLALLQADPAAQAKFGALQSVTDAAQARIKALA